MAKYGAPSSNKISGQGGMKAPPMGYSPTSASKPGGTPTGSTPTAGQGSYKGMHVPGVGGSGKTIAGPKPYKSK